MNNPASSGRPRVLMVHIRRYHLTAKIRGFDFQERFQRDGWTADLVEWPGRDEGWRDWSRSGPEWDLIRRARGYDLVYLLKIPSLRFLQRLKRHTRAAVVFDLSDVLWKGSFVTVWPDLSAILAGSDAVFSVNEYDARYARQFNRQVVPLPPYAPTAAFAARRTQAGGPPPGRITLGWVGSSTTAHAVAHLARPLARLCRAHPELQVRLLGVPPDHEVMTALAEVRVSSRADYDEAAMVDEVLGMDIGLYPVTSDVEDYCVRGILKYLIYSSGGRPSVCHRIGVCADVLTDGDQVLLAESEDEWERKLESLIQSPELRARMGARAQAYVQEHYSQDAVYVKLRDAFQAVLAAARKGGG